MPISTEVRGEFLGLKIPAWLRCFDCRGEVGEAPWTRADGAHPALFSSEKAEVDLGLRGKGFNHANEPVGGSGYGDTRVSESEARSALGDALKAAKKLQAEWLDPTKPAPPLPGGGAVLYQPIAIALCNFGWSVIADTRVSRIVAIG